MKFYAIDPGDKVSAYILMDGLEILEYGIISNENIVRILLNPSANLLIIEMIASYGMRVGRSIFETCVWIGRFIQAFQGKHELVYRKDVKLHLCGKTTANDADVRHALIDIYGGSKDKSIGKKKTPGPLYGIKKDLWQALGLGVTYLDKNFR